jgi:uncharacterized protein YjbJ (UPF0337 family)
MTLDQVQGTAKQGIGRAKEAIGEAIGNPGLQAKGLLDEAVGTVQDTYGRVSDTARDAARQVAGRARNARSDLDDLIDRDPVLVAAIALGVGIAIGLLVFGASRVAYDRR